MKKLNVVVGVAGGIAAYKMCHVVRAFKEQGHEVTVIPTEASLHFVGKATWEALSGNPVTTTVFEAVDEVRHVRLGQEADLIMVGPATADTLARVANGMGNDLLATTILAARCPVVFFPAMHTEMWENPAVQRNVQTLRSYGHTVVPPAVGRLTGKDSGAGRLPDPAQIVSISSAIAARGAGLPRDMEGQHVLITAGGTHEAIDPVRFLGNRSSGKQGFALADIAAARGATVTVVAGTTDPSLPAPLGARVLSAESAREMYRAVHTVEAEATVVVCAAAVADFRPANAADVKLKKGSEQGEPAEGLHSVSLVENPDILRSLVQVRQQRAAEQMVGEPAVEARRSGEQLAAEQAGEQRTQAGAHTAGSSHVRPGQALIVGFAAETGDAQTSPLEYAQRKLARKGCDLLVCNDVSNGKVFGHDTTEVWALDRDGHVQRMPAGTKYDVALSLWDHVVSYL